MSVATSTAIAIGLGAAGAASSLAGAKMASGAAKDAARIQGQSVDKAQGFTERAYQDQQKALAPYMQAGQQSLGSLMERYGGQPLQNRFAPGGGQAAEPRPVGGGMSLGAAMGQPQQPQGATMPGPSMPQGAPQAMQAPQGGQMARVRAPTGEIALLPEGSPGLQMALQKRAVRI